MFVCYIYMAMRVRRNGLTECLRRLRAVCSILVRNDFMEWPQLQFASDPDEWEGAEVLTIDEVAFLRNFMREGKRAPRYLVTFVNRDLWFAPDSSRHGPWNQPGLQT